MELSMLLSNSENKSGDGDWAPMPWIQDLMFTLAAEVLYDSPANLELAFGLDTDPEQ